MSIKNTNLLELTSFLAQTLTQKPVDLTGIDFSLKAGEVGVLLNRKKSNQLFAVLSGTGKILAGEMRLFKEYFDNNSELDPNMEIFREIGFGFKDKGLFSNKSLLLNVDLPARYHGEYAKGLAEGELAKRALTEIHVEESLWEKRPDFVSWYVKKRVLLARSVVMRPKILLLDSPTVTIPWKFYNKIIQWIHKQREKGCGILIRSENLPFAYCVADWVMDEQNQLIHKGDFSHIDRRILESANILKERVL